MSVTFTTAQYREDGRHGTVLWLGPDHTHAGCTLPVPCEDAVLYHGWCDTMARLCALATAAQAAGLLVGWA